MTDKTSTVGAAQPPRPIIAALECKACGRCVVACPKGLLKLGDQLNTRGYRGILYAGEGCIGCAACFYTCPEPNALAVRLPARKPAAAKKA